MAVVSHELRTPLTAISGYSDILLRNESNTDLGYFSVSNGQAAWHDLGASSSAFKVAGVGDFNGDGVSDILLFNAASTDIGYFQINNGVASWHDLGLTSAAFKIVGVGDFNGDGVSDILFRNPTSTDVGYMQVTNGQTSWHDLGSSSAAYDVAGTSEAVGLVTLEKVRAIHYRSAKGRPVEGGRLFRRA